MNALGERAMSVITGLATAIVVVALAILPFLTPQWVAFEQGQSNATGWTGFTSVELDAATGSILSDLVFGPPAFDVEVRGQAVLDERERGHMRDVKTVFTGLWVLAAAALVVLVVASRRAERRRSWRAVRRGAIGLAVAVVALGGVALVAFDALFEAFHEVLFPAGSYDFDPATERLVQLFPFQFWQETAIVVGIVILAGCAVVAAVAGRRGRLTQPGDAAAGELAPAHGTNP
ncbi:MAG: lipoprotein intramolecular transacylase Lit [Candidatus Limnocylindrales bacterium]